MKRTIGRGLSYFAANKLLRKAVNAGKRSANRTKGGKKSYLLWGGLAVAGVLAYVFRDKIKGLFKGRGGAGE